MLKAINVSPQPRHLMEWIDHNYGLKFVQETSKLEIIDTKDI